MVALNSKKKYSKFKTIFLEKILYFFISIIVFFAFLTNSVLAQENYYTKASNPFVDSLQQISNNTQKINNIKSREVELKSLYKQAFEKYEQLKNKLKTLYTEFNMLQNQPNQVAYLKQEIKNLEYKINNTYSKSKNSKPQKKLTTMVLYRKAKNYYNNKHYNKAIKYFDAFMNKYRNKSSKLYSHALLYKSESYYIIKDYDKCIVDFNKFTLDYPKSKFIPEAILKEGLCFLDIGDVSDGRYLLEKLIKDYPNSIEVRSAKMYLIKTR